jgi:hypothetical protein
MSKIISSSEPDTIRSTSQQNRINLGLSRKTSACALPSWKDGKSNTARFPQKNYSLKQAADKNNFLARLDLNHTSTLPADKSILPCSIHLGCLVHLGALWYVSLTLYSDLQFPFKCQTFHIFVQISYASIFLAFFLGLLELYIAIVFSKLKLQLVTRIILYVSAATSK